MIMKISFLFFPFLPTIAECFTSTWPSTRWIGRDGSSTMKNAQIGPPEFGPGDLSGMGFDVEGYLTRMLASMSVRYIPVKDAFSKIAERIEKIDGTVKLAQLRERTLGTDVVFPKNILSERVFCNVGLSDLVFDSYSSVSTGSTNVIYSLPSTGKTTACVRLVRNLGLAYPNGCRRLMVTAYGGDVPYADYLASELDIDDPNDVVAYIVKALEKDQEDSPASVLVLDEMNTPGERDCNIFFVAKLMRYVFDQWGIMVYVATQNREVADALCALNNYQKIGPLEGLTDPPRSKANRMGSANNGPITVKWVDSKMNWKKEEIGELLKKTFADFDEEGTADWWVEGMTPSMALENQRELRKPSQTNLREF